ncbi:MAG: hypothetical protein QW279_06320 [Candidatus Jordarchaeaceae archaeon]
MSTTKQRTKKTMEEKKELKGEMIPTLKYESIRLLRKAIIPVILASVASFIFCYFFGRFPLMYLSQVLQQIIQSKIVSSILNLPSSFMIGSFSISTDLLNFLTFIPDPLRSYVALVITVRSQIFTAASGINTFLPMCVVPIVFTAMLFTSTLKEEDVYPLLRVDRNKLLLIRSFLNVAFYTLISVIIVFFIKQYLISSEQFVQIVSPFIYALTPPFSPSLVLSTFIYLLFLQSLAVTINLYSRRAVYLLPTLLFIELIILQLPATLTGAMNMGPTLIISSTVSQLLMMGNVEILPQVMQYLTLFVILSNTGIMSTLSQVSRFLFLYQFGGLIHTFSPLFGGVWNLSFFDPQYLLQCIIIQMPDTLLFNGVNAAFAPYMAIVIMISEASTKAVYYAWFNFLYVGVTSVTLYCLVTILFGRQTL